jgi:hypothetical protein
MEWLAAQANGVASRHGTAKGAGAGSRLNDRDARSEPEPVLLAVEPDG